jgi:hypothetical protein
MTREKRINKKIKRVKKELKENYINYLLIFYIIICQEVYLILEKMHKI